MGAAVGHAWIDGRTATLETAAAEAARLLSASRLPVIAGLGTDVAGARAAIALAERLGGVVDHMHSDALLRDLDVMREAGMLVTTANEARLRADMVLAIGAALFARPDLAAALLGPPKAKDIGADVTRQVVCLGAGRGAPVPKDAEVRMIGRGAQDLPSLLAALRARVAGRPVGRAPVATKVLDRLAADLQAARFGVAVWSAAELDALVIEMLCGLVDDLNAKTRFTGLALPPDDHALGVLQTCAWTTGCPVRTGFGRGRPEHDPWRFDAARLIASGEADCILWISAGGNAPPPGEAPTIALTGPDVQLGRSVRVQIEVGRPGVDHDAVVYLAATATLAPVRAREPRATIPVAQTIARIASALPDARHADTH